MAKNIAAEGPCSLRSPALALLAMVSLSLCSCSSTRQTNQHKIGLEQGGKILNMKHIASGPVKYAALGDSTGVGVGAKDGGYVARLFKLIEPVRPGSTLTNLCFSGATSEDVVNNQLNRGVAAQPKLVTLGIGINDITHGVTLEQFASNYETILKQLTSKTDAAILLLNIPDVSTAPRIPPALRAQLSRQIISFNARIAELATKYNVALLDIYSSTHESLNSHPEFFSGDGFHPSDAGYEHWTNEVWPVIEAALSE